MKKLIVFRNTMKKLIVFGKHYEKLIVFLGSALISLWPSVRNFNSRKKLKVPVTFFEHKHEKEKLRSLKQNDEGGGVIDIERS